MKQVILLADDDEEFREVWGKVLANAGFKVVLAADPQEAWTKLRNGGIDLAILDVRIVTEVLGYLFFQRLDAANERMDKYHRELLQTYWLELLLATCEPLPAKNQIVTSEHIIKAATDSWFSATSLEQ